MRVRSLFIAFLSLSSAACAVTPEADGMPGTVDATATPGTIDTRDVQLTRVSEVGIPLVAASLAELGYFSGDIKTAAIGKVETALKAFQKDIRIPQTGRLDSITWRKLQTVRLSETTKAKLGVDTAINLDRAQQNLDILGYDPGSIRGRKMTPKMQAALLKFQKKHGLPTTGIFTPSTYVALEQAVKNKLRPAGLPAVSPKTAPAKPKRTPPRTTKPEYREPSMPKHIVFKQNEPVFVVEKAECKSEHEIWVVYYKGILHRKKNKRLEVKLTDRYALWYDKRYEGVSSGEWWCIPKKRFCYAPVKFSDWGGGFKPGDTGNFGKKLGIPARHDILPLVPALFKQKCRTTRFSKPKSWSQEELVRLISAKHYKQPRESALKGVFSDPKTLNDYLATLDPYSKYLPPEQHGFHKKSRGARHPGLGINLLFDQDKLLAVPLRKGPAYRAGFKFPRYLVSLNRDKITWDDFSSYHYLTELSEGTGIPIQVSAAAKREKVERYTIHAASFQKQPIEYLSEAERDLIRIHAFKDGNIRQLEEFVRKSMDAGKDVIIDLRYCPGGSLYEAVDALSLFLPPELEIGYLKKTGSNRLRVLSSLPGEITAGWPVYLWVSPFTASSAEVFARALKRYAKNAVIIGTPTKGKCLSQETFEFDDEAALELSVYEILGPDKKSCEGIGILPDIAVNPDHILSSRSYSRVSSK
ncbi:MAG: hypothetical protein GY862_05445 [Gammaproteobacteria bacterium]|nr:hypothetical protein [Gammaproteobacteria bacterium]